MTMDISRWLRPTLTLGLMGLAVGCGVEDKAIRSQGEMALEIKQESDAVAESGTPVTMPTGFSLRSESDASEILADIEPETEIEILGKEEGLLGGGDALPELESDFYRVRIISGDREGETGLIHAAYIDDPALNGVADKFRDKAFMLNDALDLNDQRIAFNTLVERIHGETGMAKEAFYAAFEYMFNHREYFRTTDVLSVIDYNVSSKKKRWAVVNLKEGTYKLYRTAHGKGSDRNNDGIMDAVAYDFKKAPSGKPRFRGTGRSQLGFVKLGRKSKRGSNGRDYLKMIGLEKNHNNSFVERAVILHDDWGRKSTPTAYMKSSRTLPGRSLGCVVPRYQELPEIIKALRDGTMHYNYHAELRSYRRHRQYAEKFVAALGERDVEDDAIYSYSQPMRFKTLKKKKGVEDYEITLLQMRLASFGYEVGPYDGLFGPITERAVMSFQGRFGLTPDGLVGRRSWALLWPGAMVNRLLIADSKVYALRGDQCVYHAELSKAGDLERVLEFWKGVEYVRAESDFSQACPNIREVYDVNGREISEVDLQVGEATKDGKYRYSVGPSNRRNRVNIAIYKGDELVRALDTKSTNVLADLLEEYPTSVAIGYHETPVSR